MFEGTLTEILRRIPEKDRLVIACATRLGIHPLLITDVEVGRDDAGEQTVRAIIDFGKVPDLAIMIVRNNPVCSISQMRDAWDYIEKKFPIEVGKPISYERGPG